MLSSQFLRFAIVGAIAFVVDAVLLLIAIEGLRWAPEVARILSFLGAVTTTWYLNRTFTFRTQKAPSLVEFLSYLGGMQVGLATNFSTFFLVLYLSDTATRYPIIALAIATIAGMTLNFLISRRILQK